MAPCAIVLEQSLLKLPSQQFVKRRSLTSVIQLSPVVVFMSPVKSGKFNPMILDVK